ncbi:putative sodium-coupled neutral amino acid transporter 10 [Anoplophora glabripennis]|uniref:putative sodium-coupled neutral amino acid transporter 10 n=1 Tax=Anoplophora glabripennis TaxID=217634 RepID=UPI0008746561|nr:putative sodium-coupled neutral amino acid transporter 10 [Anoplophora glabripennis]
MDYQTGHVMNLANSIIGVSVLAMPYCFKQCGIVLSILMLLMSSIISRLACHFLLKSAIIARRKTFEFLAFYIFGAMGKFAIEIGIIGFLIGTCIAFFVVMGDLGPEIIAEITGSYTTNTMRTSILMALSLFCVLPLGLLRNVDSLSGVSRATIGFYFCLVLKIVFEGIPHIFSGDWYNNVNFWRPAGILQCLPIFTMALFCQTQLFEIYQALQNATLEEMNNLVRIAVNICTCVYTFVGVFGYIAFFQKPFTGNILLSFSPSLMTDVIKIGFILSVAFSFPLVIFPCRASLYSLLYKEGYPIHEGMSAYIPEGRFKGLTLFIVFISLIIGIMIPNIELVLGLVGSTIGVMICVLFPVTCFICISQKNTNERILAQLMLMIGVFVMVLGTYKNLYSMESLEPNTVTISSFKNLEQLELNVGRAADKIEMAKNIVEKIPTTAKIMNVESKINVGEKVTTVKVVGNEELIEIRHEPPQPIEPVEEPEVKNKEPPERVLEPEKDKVEKVNPPEIPKLLDKPTNDSKNDEVDIEAIKKEDKEVQQQEEENINKGDANQALLDTIQKQNEVQMKIMEQHKKLNEERVKAMKEIETIARQAIEKISGGKEDDKIVADLKKQVNENVKLDTGDETIVNDNSRGKERNNVNKNLDNSSKEKKLRENAIEGSMNERKEQLVAGPDSLIDDGNREKNIAAKDNAQDDKHDEKLNGENIQKDLRERKVLSENTEDVNNKQKEAPLVKHPNSPVNNIDQEQKIVEKVAESKENVPIPKKPELPEIIQRNNAPLLPNISIASINNTAPLFLKLGKSDSKMEENNVPKMVPLPLIMSGNVPNNLSKPESPPKEPKEKDNEDNSKEELKALRKDIL